MSEDMATPKMSVGKAAAPAALAAKDVKSVPPTPTKPCAYVSSLTFSDGNTLEFGPEDIVVFVGPNNSGKSLALREISQYLHSFAHEGKVIKKLTYDRVGTTDEVLKWLANTSTVSYGTPGNPHYGGYGYGVHKTNVESWWNAGPTQALHELSKVFCNHLTAEARLTAANPAKNIKITSEPPNHPIHYLQIDDNTENQMSRYFKKAFGQELIVHRNAGNEVPLHVGTRPEPPKGKDRVSLEYLRELEKLPRLENQGDGMWSFAGVFLIVRLGIRSISVLVEPEAFLHPPQAKLLGGMLANERTDNHQLFIATHSRDVLHGLIDAKSKHVRVIRIRRDGQVNHVRELNSDGIRELWSDPILRYSNTLNGIFHEHVVLCEADSDCRFYQAMADSLFASDEGSKQPDVLFIHCGGKQRLAQIVKALRGLDVPMSVIPDFDVLNDEKPLSDIVEAYGKKWADYAREWKIIKSNVDGFKPELKTDDVKREIENLLKTVTEGIFPKPAVESIQAVLRRSSPWAHLKHAGKAGLPAGEAARAFADLNENLRKIGIFIVPVGELESFDKTTGNHGPKWVNSVLEKNLATDGELKDARAFIDELYQHIRGDKKEQKKAA